MDAGRPEKDMSHMVPSRTPDGCRAVDTVCARGKQIIFSLSRVVVVCPAAAEEGRGESFVVRTSPFGV